MFHVPMRVAATCSVRNVLRFAVQTAQSPLQLIETRSRYQYERLTEIHQVSFASVLFPIIPHDRGSPPPRSPIDNIRCASTILAKRSILSRRMAGRSCSRMYPMRSVTRRRRAARTDVNQIQLMPFSTSFDIGNAIALVRASKLSYEEPGLIETTALREWEYHRFQFVDAGGTQVFWQRTTTAF